MMPLARRPFLGLFLSTLLMLGTISVAAAAPQIEIEGRLNLSSYPGVWWADRFARFFDVDGDGGKDYAYGGDDTDQSYLIIRVDRGNGVYDFVHQRSWIEYVIPSALAAGDLNGDGVREIVYATALSSVVVLTRGQNGLYTESSQFPIQSSYVALETGDVDGDGDVDIVGLRQDGTLRIHWNQNGAFPGAPSVIQVFSVPRGLALGDLDGDGDLDAVVAIAAGSGGVAVLQNLGNGTFGPPVFTPAPTAPSAILLADFDLDGALDVATANPSSAVVCVMRNLGGGVLAAAVTSPAGLACQRLDAGDVDGDLEPDLVVTGVSNGGVALLLHAGAGSFAAPVPYGSGSIPHAALTDIGVRAATRAHSERAWAA